MPQGHPLARLDEDRRNIIASKLKAIGYPSQLGDTYRGRTAIAITLRPGCGCGFAVLLEETDRGVCYRLHESPYRRLFEVARDPWFPFLLPAERAQLGPDAVHAAEDRLPDRDDDADDRDDDELDRDDDELDHDDDELDHDDDADDRDDDELDRDDDELDHDDDELDHDDDELDRDAPEELRRSAGAPAPPLPDDDEYDLVMHRDLNNYLSELEEWAKANAKDARRDLVAYWVFKAPAIASSAFAGLFAYLQLPVAGLVTSSVATLCMLIDSRHPRGVLRNAHVRATHDLRHLQHAALREWRTRAEGEDDRAVAREIISEIGAKYDKVATYLRQAETALKESSDIIDE